MLKSRSALEAAAFDGGDDFVDVEAGLPVEDADGDVDLGVADALGGEVAEHVVGDELVVGGGVEAGGDGFEAEEEAGEVVVGVDGAGFGEGEGGGVVAEGELDEGFGGDGAFEVEMELGFGEAAEPEFGVGLFGVGDLPGACHRSSVVNWDGISVAGGADRLRKRGSPWCWCGWASGEPRSHMRDLGRPLGWRERLRGRGGGFRPSGAARGCRGRACRGRG